MRISDWSSDVCSSDLELCELGLGRLLVLDGADLLVEADRLAEMADCRLEQRGLAARHRIIGLGVECGGGRGAGATQGLEQFRAGLVGHVDRKSTRLNSSH